MKSVLRSAKPYWIYLILTGKKTVEVGKDFPKSVDWNRVVEMYCSKDMRSFNRIPEKDREWMSKYLGKVACRLVCDKVDINYPILIPNTDIALYNDEWVLGSKAEDACLTLKEIAEYGKGKPVYGWHISDLKIYDKPKELEEFKYPCQRGYNDINNAWCYRERGARLTMCKYNDMKNNCCNAYLTRPPQSWCYVEKL